MASPSSSPRDWLELGLGFKSTNKQQQQDEDEKKLASSTTSQHLEGHNDDEEEGLDLRLQIGPQKFDINMNMDYSVNKFGHFDGFSSAPNSGLWFSLRSSPNRKGGAALPQIPKAYIRVKDEKMTVLMVKKYLVTKLFLSNEAEVELWCMGERLVQTQSLKEVRDGVWLPKLVEFVKSNNSSLLSTSSIFHHQNQTLSSSSSTTFLMCLYYGRRTCLF